MSWFISVQAQHRTLCGLTGDSDMPYGYVHVWTLKHKYYVVEIIKIFLF